MDGRAIDGPARVVRPSVHNIDQSDDRIDSTDQLSDCIPGLHEPDVVVVEQPREHALGGGGGLGEDAGGARGGVTAHARLQGRGEGGAGEAEQHQWDHSDYN